MSNSPLRDSIHELFDPVYVRETDRLFVNDRFVNERVYGQFDQGGTEGQFGNDRYVSERMYGQFDDRRGQFESWSPALDRIQVEEYRERIVRRGGYGERFTGSHGEIRRGYGERGTSGDGRRGSCGFIRRGTGENDMYSVDNVREMEENIKKLKARKRKKRRKIEDEIEIQKQGVYERKKEKRKKKKQIERKADKIYDFLVARLEKLEKENDFRKIEEERIRIRAREKKRKKEIYKRSLQEQILSKLHQLEEVKISLKEKQDDLLRDLEELYLWEIDQLEKNIDESYYTFEKPEDCDTFWDIYDNENWGETEYGIKRFVPCDALTADILIQPAPTQLEEISFQVRKKPFASGAQRIAWPMMLNGEKYVLKTFKNPKMELNEHYSLQNLDSTVTSIYITQEFLKTSNSGKEINFIPVQCIDMVDRAFGKHKRFANIERYVSGEFDKFNSNSGYVNQKVGLTAQSLSHFSWTFSNKELIIVDLQGINTPSEYILTDPAIHSISKKRFGSTNLGAKGIDQFFHRHACNSICKSLSLKRAKTQHLPDEDKETTIHLEPFTI